MSTQSRWLQRFAALAVFSFSAAAFGAEITFFEYPGFGGGQLTLRGYTPNIVSTGFNDRASSIVVGSGRWEVCTDVEFKGTCVTFTRGEYPGLDPRLNGRISSAREVGSYGDRREGYGNYGSGQIELFSQPNFTGRSVSLEREQAEFAGIGFNDRAASAVVTSGVWELCADNGFAGNCRRYPPGRYPDLGYGMARQVSSARVVRAVSDAPAVVRGGYVPAPVVGRIVLYEEPGLAGRSLSVSSGIVDLQSTGFGEDGPTSAYVESGSWSLCVRPNFGGRCLVLGPGRYDDLYQAGLRRPVASLQPTVAVVAAAPTAPAVAPPPPARRAAVEFFSDADFGGERLLIDTDTPALLRSGFNDRAASLIVHGGQWELCVDDLYRGCTVFGPGRYPRIGGLTRQLSSARRLE